MATGFGLRLVGTTRGTEAKIETYVAAAADGTALFKGDVVKLVATTGTMDAAAEYITCTRFATGEIPLGVVVGFKPSGSALLTANYRAASTLRYVEVCNDPDAIYAIQEDAVGGSITAAQVGAMTNCAIIVAAGVTATGMSGTMLDSSQVTASAADAKVLGVLKDGSNAAAQSGGAILLVKLLGTAVAATDSQS